MRLKPRLLEQSVPALPIESTPLAGFVLSSIIEQIGENQKNENKPKRGWILKDGCRRANKTINHALMTG